MVKDNFYKKKCNGYNEDKINKDSKDNQNERKGANVHEKKSYKKQIPLILQNHDKNWKTYQFCQYDFHYNPKKRKKNDASTKNNASFITVPENIKLQNQLKILQKNESNEINNLNNPYNAMGNQVDTNKTLSAVTETRKIIAPSAQINNMTAVSEKNEDTKTEQSENKNELFRIEKDKEDNKERLLKICDWEGKTLKTIENEFNDFKKTGKLLPNGKSNTNNTIQVKEKLPCNSDNKYNKEKISNKSLQPNSATITISSSSKEALKPQQPQTQLQPSFVSSQNYSSKFWQGNITEQCDSNTQNVNELKK